jgi:ATP-dependent Clp protease ATP-binding subunit ClpB
MGSNVIRENFAHMTPQNHDEVVETTKQQVLEMLKENIRPEFLNRIDETIMFTPLNEHEIEQIVGLQVNAISKMLAANGVTLEVTPAALKATTPNLVLVRLSVLFIV